MVQNPTVMSRPIPFISTSFRYRKNSTKKLKTVRHAQNKKTPEVGVRGFLAILWMILEVSIDCSTQFSHILMHIVKMGFEVSQASLH